MKFRLAWALMLLTACSQPVRRDAPPAEQTAEPTLPPGTLRRRIWILAFRSAQGPEALPGPLKQVPVARILQRSLVRAYSKPNSPFVAEGGEGEPRVEAVDSSASDKDIQRFARDSGAGGYLKGEISELRLETQEAPEGLLRAKTSELRLTVSFEFFDAASGRKLYSGSAYETRSESESRMFSDDGPVIEDLEAKIDRMTQALADKILSKTAPLAGHLGWRARVVRLDGSRIFINSGRRTGIEVGDILRVVDPAREIIDPQTGEKVGEAPGRLKATLRVIQNFGADGSVAVLQSGGGVSAGDQVELN